MNGNRYFFLYLSCCSGHLMLLADGQLIEVRDGSSISHSSDLGITEHRPHLRTPVRRSSVKELLPFVKATPHSCWFGNGTLIALVVFTLYPAVWEWGMLRQATQLACRFFELRFLL
ncbi:hypothetical protein BX600DRAFT_448897 [Xylariales sp. PMI_506]|nr:hypothetical protein BX600DRAFT_448897 [Xylariales sp. PMI_506]